ncbi:hypothetical protein AAFF_G00135760 [Aldrovandia affinis]|uniref:Uncharacterized protein n=1 Tax=Aldrovandia affinis TaxID=143900 RepID=A0AAD7RQ69_9TELE|nr:hypothetical protein AAFF_G00135760 [Aldrovandia affinis]
MTTLPLSSTLVGVTGRRCAVLPDAVFLCGAQIRHQRHIHGRRLLSFASRSDTASPGLTGKQKDLRSQDEAGIEGTPTSSGTFHGSSEVWRSADLVGGAGLETSDLCTFAVCTRFTSQLRRHAQIILRSALLNLRKC